jgi:hypothetical protein
MLFRLERLAAWILPFAAVCLFLSALIMAVHSGEMRWGPAGITMYAVCVGMWIAVAVLRRTSTAESTSPTVSTTQRLPTESAPVEPAFQSEFQRFSSFANVLFPWLALAVLTGSTFVAANRKQQEWLTTAIVSLCGWCLVWIAHLVLPSLKRTKPATYGSQQSAILATNRYLFAGLLLLSFFIVGAAVRFSVNTGRIIWLAIAAVALVGYFAGLTSRFTSQPQTVVGFSLTVLPGVLLLALASGTAFAVYLHRLTWMAASVLGYIGCLAIWLFQMIRLCLSKTSKCLREGELYSFIILADAHCSHDTPRNSVLNLSFACCP